jgi:hypothetical protein
MTARSRRVKQREVQIKHYCKLIFIKVTVFWSVVWEMYKYFLRTFHQMLVPTYHSTQHQVQKTGIFIVRTMYLSNICKFYVIYSYKTQDNVWCLVNKTVISRMFKAAFLCRLNRNCMHILHTVFLYRLALKGSAEEVLGCKFCFI